MKKICLILILLVISALCFAQAFDDLPFTNPDFLTWFQQEMSSLMRFQFENNINVPFFATFSVRSAPFPYKPEYAERILAQEGGRHHLDPDHPTASDMSFGGLLGGQFKVNDSLYIPIMFSFAASDYVSVIDGEWEIKENGYGQAWPAPYTLYRESIGAFLGSGLSINTGILKGGIYLGYGGNSNISNKNPDDFGSPGIRIAIVPLVDTSSMSYIGRVLSSVMGYLGLGDAVMYAEKEKGDSKISAFVKTINAGLDFTFNKFTFGPLSMKVNAIYLRGNFNVAAKTDTYGLKLQGRLSRFPLGFSAEGGYKHFFALSPKLYYPDTIYVNASLFFPLKYVTIGTIYQYDRIYESKFIFAVSTNFLSGYYAYNPRTNYNREQFDGPGDNYDFGARFRWGGWKAGK